MKADRRQILCILAGILLCVLAYQNSRKEAALEEGVLIRRPSYGEEDAEEPVVVQGLAEEEVEVTLPVGGREYTEKEAYAAMDGLADTLPETILGENVSLAEIRRPLHLPDRDDATGILIDWEPDDPSILADDGTFDGKNLPESGINTGISAIFRVGDYRKEYSWELTLFPPEETGAEAEIGSYLDFVAAEDRKQRTEETLRLPETYNGKALSYARPQDNSFLLFPIFGIGAALVLPLLDRQKEEEKKKKRQLQMMRDYPEIVSRLVVLTGAGLPVRRAFEQIAAEYQKSGKSRAAYDEMVRAVSNMSRGMPEIRAYDDFAARCHCLPYRKLAGLLGQNVRNGSGHLREALEAEMENAFEERKNLARRTGEEASTKILIPLVLILTVIMIMVSVPAFLSFLAE